MTLVSARKGTGNLYPLETGSCTTNQALFIHLTAFLQLKRRALDIRRLRMRISAAGYRFEFMKIYVCRCPMNCKLRPQSTRINMDGIQFGE